MHCFAHSLGRINRHRQGHRGGLHIVLFEGGLGIHPRSGARTRAVTVFCDMLTELTGHMKPRRRTEAYGADDTDIFVAVQHLDPHAKYVAVAAFSALEDGPVAMGSPLLRDKEGILK